jgi:uncharacterized membrane protein
VGIGERRSLAAIGGGYLAGIVLYSRLPGPELMGAPSVMLVRPLIAFMLPTTAAVIFVLLRHLWLRDPIRGGDVTLQATYDAIVFRIILFVIAIHALVVVELAGIELVRASAGRLVLVVAGLTLAGIGNLLPRTRPNLVFGIRTSRTLTSRQVWIEIHRVVGYAAVGLGGVVAVSGALLPGPVMPLVVGAAGLVATAAVAVSYRRCVRA